MHLKVTLQDFELIIVNGELVESSGITKSIVISKFFPSSLLWTNNVITLIQSYRYYSKETYLDWKTLSIFFSKLLHQIESQLLQNLRRIIISKCNFSFKNYEELIDLVESTPLLCLIREPDKTKLNVVFSMR